MSEFKKIEDGKVEITATVDGEKWANAKKKAFKKLLGNLSIKGFRKGQVPENLAKKYISDAEVNYEAVNDMTKKVFEEVLDEHKVELIDQASLNIPELDNDHAVLTFTCPVKPDVKLGDYKSLKYVEEETVVTDEEVEKEISDVLNRKADLELKEDGAVEEGDTAVIDFEGFKDGVAFDGGKGENFDLVIGSHSFIPGFEEQLIGMKAEEEKDINVTFPEDYHVADLKGAPVVFKVTVHEIKKKVLPELDEEFIKTMKIDNVNTVDEYKTYVKDNLTRMKKSENENAASEKLLEEFADICEVNVPDVMVNQEVESLIQEQANRLIYQGITMEQYRQIIGQNEEAMKKALEPSALKRVKVSLCLEALVKEENIQVSDEDVDKHYEEIANSYGMPVADIKNYIPIENVKNDLQLSKAIEVLKNNK